MSEAAEKNMDKYDSYKLAYERIKLALKAGFPLEAIAIEESIISDRYLSFLRRDSDRNYRGLWDLMNSVKTCCQKEHDDVGETLASRVDSWRVQRNGLLHGIVKSDPRTAPQVDANEFVENAMKCANEGKTLARDVCNWHRKRKSAYAAMCDACDEKSSQAVK